MDATRALSGTVGQWISQPGVNGPLSRVYDSKSSEEDPELRVGCIQVLAHQVSYDSLLSPDEPAQDETHKVTSKLSNIKTILGVTCYYIGEPTNTSWYTDGSKHHGRAGRGIGNGNLRAAFRVHEQQHAYHAEMMACALASGGVLARRARARHFFLPFPARAYFCPPLTKQSGVPSCSV